VTETARICATFRVRAYGRLARGVAGTLVVISHGSLPLLLAAVVLATDPPILAPDLIQLFLLLAALPAGGAWLLARAADAVVEVDPAEVVVRRRRQRIEVPTAAIVRVTAWRLPLPAPGLALRLQSGRALSYGLELSDPAALVDALAEVARISNIPVSATHPLLVYAHARTAVHRRWYHAFGKFVLFALLPTAVLFNTHQHIAYGGLLGQYYLLGLGAYLRTFVVYWATVAIYLVLYASAWRAGAEGTCLVAAAVAPSRAARVRRVAEMVCAIGYYAGALVLLGLRFLA
jgi:hypothetical protein